MSGAAAVVIGIGNPFRRDDGVGPAVIALLAPRIPPGVRLVVADGEPTGLIEEWRDAATVVLVDAATGGAGPPGAVHTSVVGPGGEARFAPGGTSSHGLGLADALRLAAVLGTAPERVVVHAVEVASTADGVGLSPAVRAAGSRVAEAVLAELDARPGTKPSAAGDVRL